MNNHEAQGSQGAADSVPTDSQGQTEPSSSTPLQPEDPVGRSRSQPPWLILGIGAIAIVAGGGAWWLHAARYESTNDAQITAHIYQVSSQVPGKVQAVSITENQAVKVGELLVRLDPNDYQVKVEQAEAALAVAKRQAQAAQTSVTVAATTARAQTTQAQGNVQAAQAAIATAQAALKTAQEGVPLAEAQLKQAQAKLTQAKTDADRYQKLYAAGAVSAEERDSYQTSYEVAQQQLEVAQQQVNQAQTQLTQAQTQLNQAQAEAKTQQGGLEQVQADVAKTQVSQQQSQVADAQINQAQAQVQAAQLQLSHTQISAPAAGRVAQKNVEVGEQVQTGQALLAIVGTDPWIIANFKETQVARMQPGQPVTITIDALPGQRFDGTVTSLAPGTGSEFALLPADNATGNFTKVTQRVPIKVEFNPQSLGSEASRVVPGLSVEVRVKVK